MLMEIHIVINTANAIEHDQSFVAPVKRYKEYSTSYILCVFAPYAHFVHFSAFKRPINAEKS